LREVKIRGGKGRGGEGVKNVFFLFFWLTYVDDNDGCDRNKQCGPPSADMKDAPLPT
jgi:hypothetical protein